MPQPQDGLRAMTAQRRVGVRLWLGLAFAGVGVLTALSVYLFVTNQTGKAISERETEIAVGRTVRLGNRLGNGYPQTTQHRVQEANGDSFAAWAFDGNGHLLTHSAVPKSGGVALTGVDSREEAVNQALKGQTFHQSLPDGVNVTAAPIRATVPTGGAGGAPPEEAAGGGGLSPGAPAAAP